MIPWKEPPQYFPSPALHVAVVLPSARANLSGHMSAEDNKWMMGSITDQSGLGRLICIASQTRSQPELTH